MAPAGPPPLPAIYVSCLPPLPATAEPPGLGLLAFQSLFARDLNLLFGIFFLSACLVVVVNLLVDLLYASLDPRIEVG